MRAHNVIIVSSGAADSSTSLDEIIRSVRSVDKQPILVLGPDGDEVLANCNEVENCELVFDPNFAGGFFSGVKAGLHATHGAAFVVPLRSATADVSQLLTSLENAVEGDGTAAEFDVLCAASKDDASALSRSETVCLVTQRGVQNLRKVPAQTDWETFEDLTIEHLRL